VVVRYEVQQPARGVERIPVPLIHEKPRPPRRQRTVAVDLVAVAAAALRTRAPASWVSDLWHQQQVWQGWDGVGRMVATDPTWRVVIEPYPYNGKVATLRINRDCGVEVTVRDDGGADWTGVVHSNATPDAVVGMIDTMLRLMGIRYR
jgi:hypothetical protein